MGRPKGATNLLTRARDKSNQRLADRYGDPVESILARRNQLVEERNELLALRATLQAQASRHRKVKTIAGLDVKIGQLDDRILRHNAEAANYVRPKYTAIAHSGAEVSQNVVVMPAEIKDTEAWLKQHAPPGVSRTPIRITDGQRLKIVPPKSPEITRAIPPPVAEVLKPVVDTINAIADAENVISQWDRKFLTGY